MNLLPIKNYKIIHKTKLEKYWQCDKSLASLINFFTNERKKTQTSPQIHNRKIGKEHE